MSRAREKMIPTRLGPGGMAVRRAPWILRRVADRPGVDAWEAYRINLARILDILKAHHLEYFVTRASSGQRPVLGVTEVSARALLADLRGRRDTRSTYVTYEISGRRRTRRVGLLSNRDQIAVPGRSFTLFIDLHDRITGRRFGREYGCEIEVWTDEGGSLRSKKPRPARTREITPQARRSPQPIEVYGYGAVTYPPFHQPAIFQVSFSIDAVYLWVDGSDRAWQERKAKRLGSTGELDAGETKTDPRYRQFDELRYSLRSLERYAPWIRNVYLVTDRQRPSWLDETGTNLRVIDHTEILPSSALPTFNSHALTARLHHIPGLSDYFLVMNDDVLFGRPVPPEQFFQGNGVAKFFQSRTRITPEPGSTHECARLHTCDLIEAITGLRPTHVMRHTPVPLNRQLLADLEEECATEWRSTVHNPFRTAGDIVPSYLHHYLGYARKLTTPATISYRYFGFPTDPAMEALHTYQRIDAAEVVCVNDLGGEVDYLDERRATLVSILETLYPHNSSYERPK